MAKTKKSHALRETENELFTSKAQNFDTDLFGCKRILFDFTTAVYDGLPLFSVGCDATGRNVMSLELPTVESGRPKEYAEIAAEIQLFAIIDPDQVATAYAATTKIADIFNGKFNKEHLPAKMGIFSGNAIYELKFPMDVAAFMKREYADGNMACLWNALNVKHFSDLARKYKAFCEKKGLITL